MSLRTIFGRNGQDIFGSVFADFCAGLKNTKCESNTSKKAFKQNCKRQIQMKKIILSVDVLSAEKQGTQC